MSKFKGKVGLVTGGTSGIGLAAVSLLRAEGAEVIAVGTNPERLATVREIVGSNGLVVEADLRKLSGIDKVIEVVRKKYGKLDIVYANAGLGLAAPLQAVTEEQIDEQFGVNFKGQFFTVQKAVPLLGEGGSIVLTTSWLNTVGTPGLSILSASKAAVRSLTRSLAAELVPKGIRVNSVSPGPIATPFVSKVGLDETSVKAFAEAIVGQVPLRRFGSAEEVAQAALFLAGPESSYITGTEVVVDGGLSQV